MQSAHNPSYQRLPLPPNVQIAAMPPPPVGHQASAAPPGGIPAGQFRQQPTPQPQHPPPQLQARPSPATAIPPMPQQQIQQPAPVPQAPASSQPKTLFQKKRKARKELQEAIGHSNEVLASAQTVFPFVLFPDTIMVDRGKLTITHHSFFKTAEVTSIRIEDILNTTANVGPFFGSLKVTTRFFGTDKDYMINYLRRADTLKIKQILQGYIIALRKNIDCSVLSTEELARMLRELGAEASHK